MRLIAITHAKGGVGKTTTAVNLSHGLARANAKVLLVDCDTQNSATEALGISDNSAGLTRFVLRERPPEKCFLEARKNLWVLSGGYGLIDLKNRIAASRGKSRFQVLRKSFNHSGFHPIDFVVFDVAPGWDILSMNILSASTEVLTPVALEEMAVRTFPKFVKHVRAAMTANPSLKLKYVLPTFYDRRVKKSSVYLDELRRRYPNRICGPIRYNVKLSEAPKHGKTIFEYARRSVGSEDYAALTDHILSF